MRDVLSFCGLSLVFAVLASWGVLNGAELGDWVLAAMFSVGSLIAAVKCVFE